MATTYPRLHWLPSDPEFRPKLRTLATAGSDVWSKTVALANLNLDFVATGALDGAVRRALPSMPKGLETKPVRLAVLGSSTTSHLLPSLRVGCFRRGIWADVYESSYGSYLQELLDTGSPLHEFKPNAVLLCLDAYHLAQEVGAGAEESESLVERAIQRLQQCWDLARKACSGTVLQQCPLNIFPAILGNNEHRLPSSQRAMIDLLTHRLRRAADEAGVDLVAIDDRASLDGMRAWHDFDLWHRAKQEVTPTAAPVYGDLVGRILAAKQGRSRKCLVLDLDNTLWGGIVGDDGLNGIVLGQGSALGEGFSALQRYALQLAQRGVILAVSSKNDHQNAMEPFEKHPEMILRPSHIASFRANWSDKATNLRAIASDLNIGLDSMVFLDDNPFERALVRQEIPAVAVPEVPDDPAQIPHIIADAGYFESSILTSEDYERTLTYQSNAERRQLEATSSNIESYLAGLEMTLIWARFDSISLPRVHQLINKTNQFNLTTKRYSEPEVEHVMHDRAAFGLQLRLVDRFGDNGIIGIVIGRKLANDDIDLDTWLMSCRVLGRQVEQITLSLVVEQAIRLGGKRLIGRYIPTKKNGMVRDHYSKLGFRTEDIGDGASRSILDISTYDKPETFIKLEEAS